MSEENSNMLLGVRDKPPALNWGFLDIVSIILNLCISEENHE